MFETKVTLDNQARKAKGMKPPPVTTSSATLTHGSGMTAPTASSQIDTKEPMMGGLVDGHCGKEAWVGGKLKHDWSELENPNAVDFPQPTQMRSSSTKAATTHLKHTEGTFSKEACRFKTGEDLET